MWNVTKVTTEEDWFERYVRIALNTTPPSLPAKRHKLGATSVQWFECEPGVAFIDARGGTPDDRVLATQYLKSMLAGHGYRVAQYDIEPDLTKVGSWGDIMAKAKRLIQSGKVQVLRNSADTVVGSVIGDHGTYQSEISREDPNSQAITQWQCDCPWDQYAWQRTRQWKKYEGRPCAHVLALYWAARSHPLDEDVHPAMQQGQLPMGVPTNPQQQMPGPAFPAPGPSPFTAPMTPGVQQQMLPGMAPPGQAVGTPPIPGMPPEVLPPFPMEGQLEPQPPQVSIPGAKPQSPLNPVQWPGGTLSSVQDGWEKFGNWTTCALGHDHWGPDGAAGLMLSHTDDQGVTRHLLQHRSPYVQHGNTWSIPGGAINPGETPEQAAHREASEEFGQLPHYNITGRTTADCGGWKYHTIHGTVDQRFDPSNDMVDPEYGVDEGYGRWHTPEEINQLPLHPGFASSWHGRVSSFKMSASPFNQQPEGFVNGNMVQIVGTDMGIAEGKSEAHGAGEYLDIRQNTKGVGEVLGVDNLPGMGQVVEVIFPLDHTGPMEPYHIRAWLRPEQLRLRPDIQRPGPFIKRRK
jgi:8-oxo-dGTP diphosphatase